MMKYFALAGLTVLFATLNGKRISEKLHLDVIETEQKHELSGEPVALPPIVETRQLLSDTLGVNLTASDIKMAKFGALFTLAAVGVVPAKANEVDALVMSKPLDLLAYWVRTRFMTANGDDKSYGGPKWRIISTDTSRFSGFIAAPLYHLRVLSAIANAPKGTSLCKKDEDTLCSSKGLLFEDEGKRFLDSLATALEDFLSVPPQTDFCDDVCRQNCRYMTQSGGKRKPWCSLGSHKCYAAEDKKPKHVDCSGPDNGQAPLGIAAMFQESAAVFADKDPMEHLREVMNKCCPSVNDCLSCRDSLKEDQPSQDEVGLYLHLAAEMADRLSVSYRMGKPEDDSECQGTKHKKDHPECQEKKKWEKPIGEQIAKGHAEKVVNSGFDIGAIASSLVRFR